jgi:hypothetical protein
MFLRSKNVNPLKRLRTLLQYIKAIHLLNKQTKKVINKQGEKKERKRRKFQDFNDERNTWETDLPRSRLQIAGRKVGVPTTYLHTRSAHRAHSSSASCVIQMSGALHLVRWMGTPNPAAAFCSGITASLCSKPSLCKTGKW